MRAHRWAVPAEVEQHPAAIADHVATERLPGHERRPHAGDHRSEVVLDRHLEHRRALYVVVVDRRHADVDRADLGGDRVRVSGGRRDVERVNDRRVATAATGPDVGGYRLQRLPRAARDEHPRALAREATSHGAADRAATAIDQRVLSFQQHASSFPVYATLDQRRLRNSSPATPAYTTAQLETARPSLPARRPFAPRLGAPRATDQAPRDYSPHDHGLSDAQQRRPEADGRVSPTSRAAHVGNER